MSDQKSATLSICVTPDEQQLIRDAAEVASLSVSAWCALRIAQAATTPAGRKRVAGVVQVIENTFTPRGARSARVSAVLRRVDDDRLREAASEVGTEKRHAWAQACVLEAAERELGAMPHGTPRRPPAVRAPQASAGEIMVSVPAVYSGLDAAAVGEVVTQLVRGTAAQILQGGGVKTAEGAARLVATLAGEATTTLRLPVPEFEVRAVAHVLAIPVPTFATALTVRACKHLQVAA